MGKRHCVKELMYGLNAILIREKSICKKTNKLSFAILFNFLLFLKQKAELLVEKEKLYG